MCSCLAVAHTLAHTHARSVCVCVRVCECVSAKALAQLRGSVCVCVSVSVSVSASVSASTKALAQLRGSACVRKRESVCVCDIQKMTIALNCETFAKNKSLSTENCYTPHTSTTSRNSDFSVSRGTNSNLHFGLIRMCTEEFEFLDLVDFGVVAFSVEFVI